MLFGCLLDCFFLFSQMCVLYLNLLWSRDTPLYLEWAPENILSPTSAPVDEEEKNEVGERIVTKANIEQTVEGVSAEEIDPDRVEVQNFNFFA
jgi:hypothetical protein